jgi:hypothetical protein
MNNKRRILSLLFSLFLTLGAVVPAWATSPAGTWSAFRTNTVGSTFFNMTASASTFCYLSRVGVRETDTAGELAQCQVVRGPIVWTLYATLGASSDADVYCSAYCYNN